MENSTSGYCAFPSSLCWTSTRAVSSESHLGRGSEPLMSPRQMAQAGKDMARGRPLHAARQGRMWLGEQPVSTSALEGQGSGSVPSPGDRGQCCGGQDAGLEPQKVCAGSWQPREVA